MTSETRVQHTPGPWRWERSSTPNNFDRYVLTERGYLLARVDSVGNGHADGNAILMASAPDLLAALERIAYEGDYCPTDEELDGIDRDHYHQILGRWDAGETARAAIRRARGED